MTSSSQIEQKTTRTAGRTRLAKALAPEDIRVGDYVTPLSVIAEVPSFFWFCEPWKLPANEPVRIRFACASDGSPLKVKSICLPFVLVRRATGECITLDLRKFQLARLDRTHAKRVWRALRKKSPPG